VLIFKTNDSKDAVTFSNKDLSSSPADDRHSSLSSNGYLQILCTGLIIKLARSRPLDCGFDRHFPRKEAKLGKREIQYERFAFEA
jgi:hypothetical protein